jgi:enoyl-CoA hydratase
MPPEAHPWFDDVAQAVLFGTDDAAQRVAAFLDRRARRGQAPR